MAESASKWPGSVRVYSFDDPAVISTSSLPSLAHHPPSFCSHSLERTVCFLFSSRTVRNPLPSFPHLAFLDKLQLFPVLRRYPTLFLNYFFLSSVLSYPTASASPTVSPSIIPSYGFVDICLLCITHVVDACPDQTRIHRLLPRKLNSRMAFFTSPEQEVFEHRLKRSPSLTSVRTRSRQPSGAPKSPTPSRTHTHSRLLPTSTSGDVSAPRPPSPIPSPIPSPVPATSPNLNGPDYDSKSSPKLSRGSMPQHVSSGLRDDFRSLRVPSVHEPVQRRQHLDTSSSPSSLPLDSRRDFDTGSLSDSGVNSRRPRSPRRSNLSAPSPRNVHLSPPMARHHSPSSPNLPIAGYFSDGERSPSFLHPSRLDVKRLLSKPACTKRQLDYFHHV
ncbi:hypothetical protein EDB84DRAFT_48422 [Lactarius hengduanensis]|nr:hypothetical protein EDB84DRAFT_48422 [Lactarius hengduanensis]